MSICPSCGAGLTPEQKFCEGCGVSLIDGAYESDPYAPTEALMAENSRNVDSDFHSVEKVADYSIKFGVTEVINASIALWSGALGRLTVLSLIQFVLPFAIGIVAIVAVFFPLISTSVEQSIPFMVGILVMVLIGTAVISIPSAVGMILVLDDQARYGEARRGPGQAFAEGFHFFWRYAGVSLSLGIVGFLLMTPMAMGIATEIWSLAVFFGIIGFVVWIWISVRLIVSFPALVLEDLSVVEAISRSFELVGSYWWSVFGAMLLFMLMIIGMSIIVSILGIIPIIGQLIGLAFQLFFGPLVYAFLFSLYAGLYSEQEHGGY